MEGQREMDSAKALGVSAGLGEFQELQGETIWSLGF